VLDGFASDDDDDDDDDEDDRNTLVVCILLIISPQVSPSLTVNCCPVLIIKISMMSSPLISHDISLPQHSIIFSIIKGIFRLDTTVFKQISDDTDEDDFDFVESSLSSSLFLSLYFSLSSYTAHTF
jgi:hypothetical protein